MRGRAKFVLKPAIFTETLTFFKKVKSDETVFGYDLDLPYAMRSRSQIIDIHCSAEKEAREQEADTSMDEEDVGSNVELPEDEVTFAEDCRLHVSTQKLDEGVRNAIKNLHLSDKTTEAS